MKVTENVKSLAEKVSRSLKSIGIASALALTLSSCND